MNPADQGPNALTESTPNSARLYDFYLGGTHNFAADRDLAEKILAQAPITRDGAQANRAFMRRAVRYLTEQGIDQFLDLGSGVPTAGNVHEIAQSLNPDAHVVYVDYEPVAYDTATKMLADIPNATIIQADLRKPDEILEHPKTQELLDFNRPIGLLIVGALLFIPDADRPADIIAAYRGAAAPGSFLALSHTGTEEADEDVRAQMEYAASSYRNATERFHLRSKAEFSSWFDGTDLIEPGVVTYHGWRPDGPLTETERRASPIGYVGVGKIS